MNEDQGPDDHFDRLSDELLTLIFNKVLDAKSLCRCSVVSKRFASLIPQTDNVSLIVPSSNSSKPNRDEDETYQFTTEVLRNFINIKRLSIQLPCHGDELGSKGTDYFLRWKAEFGRELESCVVLGATSFHRSSSTPSSHKKRKQLHEPMSATDELKTRVVWMISCLIAASTRHWLLKQIIADIPMNPRV
ncbi:F-box protein [Vitis vinifera]|uniref:F-box protein n=1 Tax=Vitis vinifera TaxID=29760 RepID=A0A438F2S2_VITVI|nr:F-box protein [Vitis vinifera]